MDNRYSELIKEIVIDNFSEYIQTTAKIRPKPYIKGQCKIPLKYQNSNYEFKQLTYFGKSMEALVLKETGEIVPSNSKTVNRPRLKKVNGQDVYNQNAMTFGRAKIVNILHDYFDKHLDSISPIDNIELYPLHLEMSFYVHDMGRNNIDNDNKWIWRKCLQDTMVNKGIIPDDNVYNIAKNSEETYLIPGDQTQKLIIRIYGQNSGS